jgi:hypothetical protein
MARESKKVGGPKVTGVTLKAEETAVTPSYYMGAVEQHAKAQEEAIKKHREEGKSLMEEYRIRGPITETATGGDFLAKKPELFLGGEGGAEFVRVQSAMERGQDREAKTHFDEGEMGKPVMVPPQPTPLKDVHESMKEQMYSAEGATNKEQYGSADLAKISDLSGEQVNHLAVIAQGIQTLIAQNEEEPSYGGVPADDPRTKQKQKPGSTDFAQWQFGFFRGSSNRQMVTDGM